MVSLTLIVAHWATRMSFIFAVIVAVGGSTKGIDSVVINAFGLFPLAHSVGVWALSSAFPVLCVGVVTNTVPTLHDGIVNTGSLTDLAVAIDTDSSS